MKLIKCIALFILIGFSAEAQKYELGEVTKQDLEEKVHPQDPSAPAAILFSKGHTYFTFSDSEGFQLVTQVERENLTRPDTKKTPSGDGAKGTEELGVSEPAGLGAYWATGISETRSS